MPKATFNLPNGTLVSIEGEPEDIKELLAFYSDTGSKPRKLHGGIQKNKPLKRDHHALEQTADENIADLTKVVSLVKDCDEAEAIDKNILERTGRVERTLIPLYIVQNYMKNAFGLTTGEVNKITTELGIPIATSNVSNTFTGPAKKYVIGDKIRKRGGTPIRYKLSRAGVKYMKSVITGTSDEK